MKYLILAFLVACSTGSEIKTSKRNANRPQKCDRNNFDEYLGNRKVLLSYCYFSPPADGMYFGEKLEAKNKYTGLYNYTNETWLIDPVYDEVISSVNQNVFLKKYNEKTFVQLNLDTKHVTPTEFTVFIEVPRSWDNSENDRIELWGLDEGVTKIAFVDYKTGEIYNKIDNVDGEIEIDSKRDRALAPYFSSFSRGYLIRRVRKNGSKYYQVYSKKGEPLSHEINAKNVYPFYVTGTMGTAITYQRSRVFFEKVGNDLYWPIFFNETEYLKKPANFKGLRFERSHLPTNDDPNWFREFKVFVGEFSGSKDLSYSDGKIQFQLALRLEGLLNQKDKPKLRDYYYVDYPELYTEIRMVKYPVFEYADRVEVPKLSPTFKNRSELNQYLANQLKTAPSHIAKRKQFREDVKQRRAEAIKNGTYVPAQTPQEAFIERIHKYGPNPTSLQTYYYDVGVYCRYKGPRCASYQQTYRNMENSSNSANELANQRRLNDVYNKSNSSSSGIGSSYGQATTDRYNSAVKSAAEKERVRVRDEQWKKKR